MDMVPFHFSKFGASMCKEMKSCSEPHLHCCWVMMIVMKSCRLGRYTSFLATNAGEL